MPKRIECDEGVLAIELYKNNVGHKVFQVRLLDGFWPSDDDLITICDNGTGLNVKTHRFHFGGNVSRTRANSKNDPIRMVVVYTD